MRKGIICGGTLVVDRIKIVDSYPKEGSLSNICSEHQNGGGAVFNVLSNLSVMDKKLPLYAAGLLGRDNNGKYLKNELINKNIDCSSISFTSRESTAITDVFISQKNGSRTFFHRKGSNSLIDIEHFEQVNPNAKIFHLGYLMILDRLDSHDDTYGTRAARLLSLLKKRGFIITVDLVTVENKSYDGILSHSLKYIDYLIINEIEAERSSLIKVREKRKISPCGLTKAALNLLRKGVQKAVIIHYPEGAFALCKNGDKIEVPSIHLDLDNIKGTVGAGDAFCSGILYSIHEGFDLFKSIEIANRAAWYNIQSETSTGGAVSIKKILNDIG